MMQDTDSRTKLIQTMSRLLQTQGFHASGVNQILAESGAVKSSLYYFFPGGKSQLAVAAIEAARQDYLQMIHDLLAADGNPAVVLDRAITNLADSLAASGYQRGCPVATVALEMAATDDDIHVASSAFFQTFMDVFAERLVTSGLPESEAESLAGVIVAAVEGALMLGQALRDTTPLRGVADYFREMLQARLDTLPGR